MRTDSDSVLTLRAPGRLHLGFLDPAGSLGRRFGSLGLVIDGIETEVELSASPLDQLIAGNEAARAELERASRYLQLLRRMRASARARSSRWRSAACSRAGMAWS